MWWTKHAKERNTIYLLIREYYDMYDSTADDVEETPVQLEDAINLSPESTLLAVTLVQ